jgi:tetratricopeptide (TPR) repeat protein
VAGGATLSIQRPRGGALALAGRLLIVGARLAAPPGAMLRHLVLASSRRRVTVVLAALILTWAASAQAAPSPPPDRREREAVEAFVTGQYQHALELFGKLYAETVHPTYLRNIGRCYQKLGDVDRALETFRDYLHKVPNLPPRERAEIEEYMADLQARKRARGDDGGPPHLRAPPPEQGAALTAAAPAPETRSSHVWLWAGLGAVAVAAVVAAVLLTRPSDADCPMGSKCFHP